MKGPQQVPMSGLWSAKYIAGSHETKGHLNVPQRRFHLTGLLSRYLASWGLPEGTSDHKRPLFLGICTYLPPCIKQVESIKFKGCSFPWLSGLWNTEAKIRLTENIYIITHLSLDSAKQPSAHCSGLIALIPEPADFCMRVCM